MQGCGIHLDRQPFLSRVLENWTSDAVSWLAAAVMIGNLLFDETDTETEELQELDKHHMNLGCTEVVQIVQH